MEHLRSVFTTVPTEALVQVLNICGQSVAVASTWLLENDWQDLMDEEQEQVASNNAMSLVSSSSIAIANADVNDNHTLVTEHPRALTLSTEANNRQEVNNHYNRRWVLDYEIQDDNFDSDDEEEDEEDEEEDLDYDSSETTALPLTKRTKVTMSRETSLQAKEDDFWIAFDGQMSVKSMIELLNTTLSKLAHRNVVLLSQPAMELDRAAATNKLKSVLALEDTVSAGCDEISGQMQSPRHASNRITMASLLNADSPTAGEKTRNSPSLVSLTSAVPARLICPKRKRKEATGAGYTPCQGFFAHFFPIGDLDMVWRTVLHAHVFQRQFGEKIEFQTASGGLFRKRDFDELMHLQNSTAPSRATSIGFSPWPMLKCCLILPCPENEVEMFRVGRNIYSILKLQGGLYYRTLDTLRSASAVSPCNDRHELLSEADKMTEERFRQFARYRITKEEPITTGTTKVNEDRSYMSYQEPRKTKYCLEMVVYELIEKPAAPQFAVIE